MDNMDNLQNDQVTEEHENDNLVDAEQTDQTEDDLLDYEEYELFEDLPFEDTTASPFTLVNTPSGDIHVVHEMTLGDILILSSIMMILILQLIKTLVRR